MSEPTVQQLQEQIRQLQKQNDRQAELIRQKISEIRFHPLDQQKGLNSGINVFALQLLAESLGHVLPTLSDGTVFFEFDHRGVRVNLKAQLIPPSAPSASPTSNS